MTKLNIPLKIGEIQEFLNHDFYKIEIRYDTENISSVRLRFE